MILDNIDSRIIWIASEKNAKGQEHFVGLNKIESIR